MSATGSAGTIAAGDYLKERFGSLIVACEALECPTLLYNGFGEHNIQGIGDKHVPLIHNVLNTDVALAVSDRATDRLGVLFGTDVGRGYLRRRGVPDDVLDALPSLGLSSICNVLGAIKVAKYYGLGPDDVVVTVATDGAAMYDSEREIALAQYFPDGFDEVAAAEVFGEHLLGTATDHLLRARHATSASGSSTSATSPGSSSRASRSRTSRRAAIPAFWARLREVVAGWDDLIDELNARTGVLEAL